MLASQVAAEALAAASSEIAHSKQKHTKRFTNLQQNSIQRKKVLRQIGKRISQYKKALHVYRVLKDDESWYITGKRFRRLLQAEAEMLALPKTARLTLPLDLPRPLDVGSLQSKLQMQVMEKAEKSSKNKMRQLRRAGPARRGRRVGKGRPKKRTHRVTRKERNKKLIALSGLYTHKQPHVELDQVSKRFRERKREVSEASETKRIERNGYGGVRPVLGGYDYESRKAGLRIKALRQDVVTIAVPDPLYDSHYAKFFRPLLPRAPSPRRRFVDLDDTGRMQAIEDELAAAMSAHSIAENKLKVTLAPRRDLSQLLNPRLKSYV